ncbi:hypothetical protein GGF32_000563 [Allomyces javanicus]|nr:hypothetical protein GGF32_000563 [Allomyces javanicus]
MNAGPAAVATAPPPPPAAYPPPMMQQQQPHPRPLRAPNAPPPPLQLQQLQQQPHAAAPGLLPAGVPAMTMPAGPTIQRAPSAAPYTQLARPPPGAAAAAFPPAPPPPPLSLPHAPGVQQQQQQQQHHHSMMPAIGGSALPPPPPAGLAFPPLRAPPSYAPLPTRTPSVALPPPPPPAAAVGAGAALTRVLALAAEWAPAPGTSDAAHQLAHWHAVVARHFVPSATWRYTTPAAAAAAAPAGGDAGAASAAAAAAPRAFELPYGFLPRYFALQYATGLVSAHLALDAPAREVVLPTGGRVLHAPKVSITHRFATGAVVVADALLRVTLVPAMVAHDAWGLKIEFWDLVVRRAEELVPRPAVARAVAEWHADVDAAFRARSQGGPASPTGLDAVAPKLKLPEAMTNEYGVAVRLMRALEIADVVNSMRDIIVYSQVNGNGDSARQRSLPTPQPSPPNVAVGSPRAAGGSTGAAATAPATAPVENGAPAPPAPSNGVASPVPPSPTFSDTALAIKSEPPSPSNNGNTTPPALASPTLAKRKSPMSSSSPSSVSSLSSTPPSPAAAAPRKVPRLDDGAMGPRSPTATHAALKKRASAAGGGRGRAGAAGGVFTKDVENSVKLMKIEQSLKDILHVLMTKIDKVQDLTPPTECGKPAYLALTFIER